MSIFLIVARMSLKSAMLATLLCFVLCGSCLAQFGNGSAPGITGQTGPTGTNGTNGANGTGALLGSLKSANFNSVADQAIPISYSAYAISRIDVTNCSGTLTLAVGGVYTATAKGGTVIVLAAQSYATLTVSTIMLQPPIVSAILTTRLTGASIYFSLTVAAGNSSTCDIYVYGDPFP